MINFNRFSHKFLDMYRLYSAEGPLRNIPSGLDFLCT